MSRPRFSLDEQSLTVRGFAIAALALLMLLPVGMIGGIVDERYARYESVVADIGAEWGGVQTLAGPIVLVPFTERWTAIETVDLGGEIESRERAFSRDGTFVVLPRTLDVAAQLDVERRQRGIYEAMVYGSKVDVAARFVAPEIAPAPGRTLDVHWADAALSLGIAAPVGIRSIEVDHGVAVSAPEPGSAFIPFPSGVHWRLSDVPGLFQDGVVKIALELNGADELSILPFGGTTTVSIGSRWPHPSFTGTSPVERRVSADGFSARWRISSLSRDYPQLFENTQASQPIMQLSSGVRLMQPVATYSLTDRAVKYAVLFIALTFTTFLVFELVTNARVHLVQYALIGTAVALFYLLLLALSEHLGFARAYTIAATTIVAMLTGYAAAALGSMKRALLIGAMQAVTYVVLWAILTLEDYALLTGTLALLVGLGLLMYFTRTLSIRVPRTEA